MSKLKTTQVKSTRLLLLEQQKNTCPICNLEITDDKAVLDHCHKKGHVRAVLHRSCNSLLGKLENNGPRYGMTREQFLNFCENVKNYIVLHEDDQTGLIHPTFFTPEERKERAKEKAKKKRLLKKQEQKQS